MLAWRVGRQAARAGGLPSLTPLANSSALLGGTVLHQAALYSKKSKKGGQAGAPPSDVAPDVAQFDLIPFKKGMEEAVGHLQKEMASMRTGRATAGMLDHLRVDIYGDHMPMKACGTATVRDPQLLVVNVFDPSTAETIAKAIRDSPLGLNPRVEGQDILVPVPRPTAESLAALKKVCKQEGEQAKATIRHQRKLAMDLAKKAASDDDKFRHGKEVEAVTQQFVNEVDELVRAKEKSISEHSA